MSDLPDSVRYVRFAGLLDYQICHLSDLSHLSISAIKENGRRMDGRMDGRTDGRTDGQTDTQTNGRTDRWTVTMCRCELQDKRLGGPQKAHELKSTNGLTDI